MPSLLWDQHTCLPLRTGADISELARYRRPGGAFVSVNVGYAPHALDDVVTLLEYFRRAVEVHPGLELAESSKISAGKVAVAFDLEDCAPLGIGQHLSERRWDDTDVTAVLGGNFRRVAEQTWLTSMP